MWRDLEQPRIKACVAGKDSPHVAIFLGSYNGDKYIAEQLDSFAAQHHKNWKVWASDDGSRDETPAILKSYAGKWGENRISFRTGPQQGFVVNFLALTFDQKIQADFYAYSDQDDIWEADKLERAVNWLVSVPVETPALYCTSSQLIDEDNQAFGYSVPFNKPPRFANALIQSLAGGNTMVFNNAARKLVIDAGIKSGVVSHDWWIYMLISGCGGQVYYENYPSIRYRQHTHNLVGMNPSWTAKIGRARRLFSSFYKKRNDVNIEALAQARCSLTEENQKIFDTFRTARKRSFFPRIMGVWRSGVYCQTLYGNISLTIAVLLNEI